MNRICWRISCRGLILDLSSHLLAILALLQYLSDYWLFVGSGAVLVLLSGYRTVAEQVNQLGLSCSIRWLGTDQLPEYRREDLPVAVHLSKIDLLWSSSYGVLIRLRAQDHTPGQWKHWIFAAELSEEHFRRLSRVLGQR